MGNSGTSGAEILRRYAEPGLTAARAAVESARLGAPEDPGLALAALSIEFLQRWIEKAIRRIVSQEIAARIAVYQVIALEGARLLGKPVERIFPAVLRLCSEPDEDLKRDFPVSDQGVIDALQARLFGVSVLYEPRVGEGAERTISMFLRDDRRMRSVQSKASLAWEEVPEDVREQAIKGQCPVSFTLYSGDSQ